MAAMAAPAIEQHCQLIEQRTDLTPSDRNGCRTARCADFCCAGVATFDEYGGDVVGDGVNPFVQPQRTRMFTAATG
jgi:hypothetical protein